MEINNNEKSANISDFLSYLQLKYDCETLCSLANVINKNGIIGLGMIPYFTLTAYSVCELLPEVIKELPCYKQIENIRLKLKFFEDGYSRSERMILNIDYLQNEDFKNRLKFDALKDKNIHYNIGIYTNKDKIIVGNTQYACYLLQDNRFLKKSLADVAKTYSIESDKFNINEQTNKDCYQYAYDCMQLISSASNGLNSLGVPVTIASQNRNVDFYYVDCNTNTAKFFSDRECNKGAVLYLLHILSTINFLIYVFNDYQLDDHGWWLKINYIIYYYSIEKLKSLREHFNQNKPFPKDLLELFDNWDLDNSPYICGEFRSCVMHSRFKEKDINSIILNSKLDISKPLFGFVETCFNGMNYNEVKTAVIVEMRLISDRIGKWLDTQSLNIKPLK